MGDQQQIVFPGDPVAIAEEFLPGPGTYEENGEVYAAKIGVLELDASEFVARVKAFTPDVAVLNVGDVVIGTVHMTRSSMAIVNVKSLADRPDRAVASDTNGTLQIRNVADHYVSSMDDEFRLGDIIRAEVTEVDPAVQLSTKGPVYGVLKRYCPRCRMPMPKKGDTALECAECGWKDSGHLAPDYGEGKLMWEGPIPERKERPRGGGGGGRGGPRGRGGDRGGRGGPRGRGGDRGGRGGDRGGRGGGRGERGGPRGRGGGRGGRGGGRGDRS